MPSYPIWTSGNTDAIAPQIYQWAQADRAEQAANVARRNDWDRQAIANQNNYYQFARGNEAQDYERQRQAEGETFRRQTVAAEEARRLASDTTNLKLQQDYLKKQDEWHALSNQDRLAKESSKRALDDAAALAGGLSWLHENLGAGKHVEKTDEQLAALSGLPVSRVSPVAKQYREAFPNQVVDQLNAKVAGIIAKTDPKKLNIDGLAGLASELPASVRDRVTFNPETKRFEHMTSAFRPMMGDLRYNFANSTTGTTPPPPVGLPQAMPFGNQASGYFQNTPAPAAPPPAAPAPQQAQRTYASEDQARAAGHRPPDIVRIAGVGIVRLK